MAAIVSSNSVGLLNSSLYVLGSQGALGQATQGRAGEQVYVNGATGNLVIQNRDELLIGRGPDLSILRTYNSQGLLDGDNNDSWRLGVYRKVYNLTGTVNTAGSTVTRVAEDGSESVYTFDATLGKYVCHDGGGAYDTLSFTSANQTWIWSWTDGTNQLTERYDAANGGRITQVLDQDGNGLTFTYNAAGLITQVSDASGETTFLDYTGTNLTQLRTVNSSAQTLVRTRYAYDASNRLITVTTDLSPEDASIADGKTYVVSYTYDGTSKRVASLTQTDGNNLSFSYVQVGTAWKIQSYTDAAGKITSLAYTQTGASTTPASATANNAVLSTTETTTSPTTVAPYYTVQSGNTWASISQAVYGTSDANAVAALQSALGNPALTAGTRLTVPQTLNYTTTASSSANGAVLSTTTTTTVAPYYTVQSGNTWSSITQAVYGTSDANAAAALQTALGNPALTAGTRLTVPQTISYTSAGTSANSAVLSTTITTSTNYNLVSSALTTPTVAWGTTASLLAGSSTLSAAAPQVKFDQNGNGMAVWALGADLFYSTYSKSNNLWSAAQTLDGTLTGNPGTPNLSMSANGNALVSWVQNSNLYARRYIAGVWDGASTIPNLENLTGAALNPVGAINDSGRAVVAFVQAVSTTNNLYANVFNGTAWQSAATVVDDIGTANANSITSTLPSVAIDSLNNATVLWLQKTGTQTVDSLYFSRFNPSTSTWGTPNSTTLENTTTAVTAASIAFDGNGNGIAIWLQGGSLLAKSYTRSSNAWSASTTLGTSASAPNLSLSANGNGLVTWVNAGNILTRRYTAAAWIGTGPTTIENLTGAASSPTGSINNAGQAVVAFVQADAGGVNNIYANRFTGGAWQSAATLIESNSNAVAATMTPSVAIDATGNVNALWLQKNGAQTTDSVFWNRFNTDTTPYYTLPGGASWSSIAAAVYGSSAPATQLQSALGNPALTAGNRLTGFPATLTVTTTSTVAPYYTVQAGNTWSSIAQTVYGDSAAAGPLQAALGNPTLAAGLNLTVPSSLSFTPVTAAANGAALSTTDTQTTSVSLNSAALTNPAGGWASPTAMETSSAAASQLLMKTSNGGDAVAVWLQGGSLFASAYDSVAQTWSAPVLASGTFTNISGAKLDVDHATGSAVLTWIDSTTNRVYANLGSWNGSSTLTWRGAQLVATATGTLAEAAGSPGGILLRTTSGTTQSLYFSFWDGTSFFSAPQLVATVTGAITSPQVVTTELGVIQIVWRASDGTAESLYTRSYDEAFWGGWVPGTTLLESSSTPVSLFLVETDIWADTNVAWVQGNDIYVNWGGDGQGWNGAVLVATSPSPISQFAYSDSAGSNAVFAWTTTDGKVYAARWGTAAELLATGTGLGDLAAYTNGSTVVVSWRAGNDLYATSHDGANWSTPALLETSSQPAATPRVAVASGQPFAIWQQSDGTANSIFASRYLSGGTGSPYYTVQAGNTWASIAQLLYGNSAAASALQSAMGNPALTAGAQLTGFPATLSVTTTVTVPAYYLMPSGASWATVTQAVYGTSDANAQLALRDALGNPALTAGAKITMPASIRHAGAAGTTTASANAAVLSTTITTTVAPYYTVSGADTWTSITQTVYGTSNANAVAALQTALGNPALSAGLRLTVPATISYTANLSSAANNAVLSTTITTTTAATVAPYYTVQSGDTWSSIAQTVYGDSQAGSALQTALGGGASPTVGAHLTVPQSLSYTKTVAGGMRTDITDPLGLMTSIVADGQGQITQILNPAVGGVRQSVTYAYDANGNVTSVTDARGLVTSYGYDANGNRMLERDAAGNTVTRVFGSKNELQTETSYVVPDPDGAGAGLPGSPLTTRYVYDVGGHLRFVVSGEGRVSEYRYNSFGQRTAAIQYTGALYNLTGLTPLQTPTEAQLVSFVTAADKTKTERIDSTYDFRGQLQTTTSYGKVDAAGVGVNDSDKAVTNYVYDQAGNLLNTVDGRGSSTTYVYDGLGRLKQSTDATGRITTTVYDDVNKKTVLTSANGLVTTSTYDARGALISVMQSATPGGVLGSTSYFYDADGRLRRTVDPTGISTHVLYDEAGRQIATIDGTGTLTEYRYDADNNLTRTIQYATAVTAVNLALLVDAQGNPTTVTLAAIRPAASGQDRSTWAAYDSANRLVKSVDELGHVTQSFYDGAGRLTDVLKSAKAMTSTAALGDIPTPASINPAATDPLDRLTRDFYDADGKLRGTLDGEGYLVEYKYDAAGQLVETVGYATVTSAGLRTTGTLAQLIPTPTPPNPDDSHSHVLYNARGQVVGVVDGEGYLTETVYDLAGNKTQVVRYATKVTYSAGATVASLRPASNAQDQVSSFTYTALNQLASATDFENTRTDYTYNEVGNLTKTVKAVNTADVRTLNAQYDKQGRLTAELSRAGSALLTGSQTQPQIDAIWAANATKYAYDAAGRRVSSADPNGNRTLYYYDADGHLTHSINAAGEVRENKYNVLGQLTQTIAYGTRLASTTLGTLTGGLVNATLTNAVTLIANAALDSVTAYSYTARGQVASSTDPLLFATTNTYDAFGDLTGSSQQIGAGQTLDHTYEFDRRGLLTRTLWDPSAVNAIELRQYDAFGRATQVTDANNNVRTQTYDRLGRVVTTSVDPGAGHLAIGTSTTYDAFDRVLTQRDALNNVTTFTYDKTNRSVTMLTPELVSVATVHNRQGETQSVTDGRGNITKYDYDLDGNLKQLTRTNAQGQAISTTVNLYDKADRLTDTVDANGNTVHFTYDAANRVLTRVVDPGNLNLTTTYEYDAKGHTTKVTDARGFATQTQFDLKGQVTSVIVDPGVGHLNLTTTYSYVGKKTLTVTEGAAGANPKVTKYTYDNLGRRIQEQVDPAGLNLTTTYTYDKKGNVVSKTEALGKPEARTTRYVYDAADRLVWTIDALGDVRKNEYDANGHVTRTIAYAKPLTYFATLPAIPVASDVSSRLSASAGDQAVNHVFDRDGREVYTIDAMGGVTQKVYDAAGNVIQTTAYAGAISVPASPTPAGVAALVSAPNPDNRITRAVYDAANRAIFAIDAMGYVTQRFYDGAGNVSKEVKYWNALQGTFTAGSAPQILATAPVPPSGSWVIVDAARDQITRQFYDAAGRMRFGVNAEGYVTERRLDAMGNETARIRYADRSTVTDSTSFANMTALFPNVALNALPATAVVEQASYDNAGRVFEVTDGEGAVTRNLYDALGNKTDVIRAFGTSLASTTHYVYDAAGREREETAAYGTAVAATTRYVLDAFGNRTGIIDPRGVEITEQDTDWAKAERLRLNLFASVAALSPQEKTDLLASYTTTLAFDKAGRRTGSTIPAGFRVPGNITTTVYDARGNAVKITDPRGNSGYFYFDANDKARFHIDPMGYVTEYRYDAFGNVKDELHYANKMTGAYDENTTLADLASRVTTSADDRQTSKVYDRVGQVSAVTYQGTPASYTEIFQYDAFGNKTQYKDKSDAVYNYEYDRVGNLKKEIAPATDVVTGISPTVTTLNTRLTTVYDYDAVGNRIKMTEASGITQVERVTVYKYDKLGRQTHIEAPAFSVFDRASGTSTTRAPVTDKTYDAAGNLVMQTAPDGGRVLNYYDALNRKVLSVDADNALHEYEYDHAGNLIRERTYDTRLTGALTWQTRPTAVNPSAYREMRYRYNANSLRTGSETRVETLWNFAKAQTQNGNGYDTVSVVTSIDYNANGDIIRTVDGNGNRTYQFYDAIGKRILQIDPLGYAIRREYNAEGQVSRETRYAVALPAVNLAALNAATTPASLAPINPQSLIDAIRPPGTQENPDDRVTEFTYDRLGRVTIERNKAVGYASVNASNGALTELQGDLDTRYEYDGNGKIKAVILPNAQGRTDYLYDALGRRTQELDPQFQAFNAYGQGLVATREETRWQYNAFGDVAVETKLALAPADNRETRRTYDSAGRLRTEVDPEGATTTYDYDIAGNVVRKTWQVKDVDLNNHTYRCYYTYDHLNRQISYQDTEDEGSALPVIRETHDTRYNAHGDIEARGVNGQFQEQYKYDRLGRLFFTNKDNGTPRLYVYDANGNASVEVQAINTDLSTVGGVPVTGPGQVGAFDPNTVQLTFSHYDARNRLTEVVQPPMDYGVLTSSPVVTANGTDAAPAGTLTDLRLFQVTGSMTPSGQLSIAAPALPPKPADPAPAFTNGTQAGFAKTLPPAPAPFGAIPQGSLGLFGTPGSSSDVTSDSSVQKIDERIDTTTNADGVVLQVVKTVTERFTRTRVETSVSTPDANSNVTRTIRTTTDVIIRKTTFTANRTEQYLGTGDTFQANWTQVKTDDTDADRRVDVTTDTLTWQHAVTRTPTTGTTGWVGADNGVHPGTPTYTLAGNIQVNTRWEEDWISDGEGGYYWGTTGFYHVDVTGPAIDYRGGDPVIVTYVWENGAAVVPVQVTMSPDKTSWSATQRIRYDGHSIIVTKGNLTLAAFGMDRNTMTASVPISYALPQSVGVWTEWQYDWISDGEGGYYWGTTGYYYVHVNVPQINYRGSDPVYVTYIWENGAAVVSVPVDANGNATGLIRYDGHGIVVTKGGPYGAPGATTLASFGMDRDTFNASVQITPQPLPTIVAIGGLNAAAARVVFTPVGRPSLTAERYDWTDSGGTHTEFHVLGQLNPGDVYDYEVYDAAGVLLNRVHGILGARESDGFTPVNYNYYSFATQDKVTGTVTRVTQPEQYYRRDNPPTAPINDGQATYLANLTQLITQGATHQNVIARRQTYNAFGEVLSEIDGNNNRSDFTYNDLGKLVLKQDPATAVHMETGAPIPGVRPTTHYYYDELGQLVGTQDAVSDLRAAADKFYSTRVLVNGRVEKEFDPYHNSKSTNYDRLGNRRLVTDEAQLDTEFRYDRGGRLTRVIRYDKQDAQYTYDAYEYDSAGERIAHTDGLGRRETYLYDGQGRIRRHISFFGRQTRYDYNYIPTIGGIGGYEKRTITTGISTGVLGDDVLIDQTDYFGKIRYHKDLGGHEFTYLYNNAGWLKQQDGTTAVLGPTAHPAQHITYDYYQNGFLKSVADTGVDSFAQFEYDNNGNRTLEKYSQVPIGGSQPTPYQVARAEYDALNRVTHVRDESRFDIRYTYDANGNRRSIESTYFDLLTSLPDQTQNFYYTYDKLNRFVITMGERDAAGNIVVGSTGYLIGYDAASRRTSAYSAHKNETTGVAAPIQENYYYDPISIVQDTVIKDLTTNAVRSTHRQNSVVGNLSSYDEYTGDLVAYNANPATTPAPVLTRHVVYTYDADNLLKLETTTDPLAAGTRQTQYDYLANGVLASTSTTTLGVSNAATVTLTYQYEYWDGYKEKSVTIAGAANDVYNWTNGTSTYAYDANGHIARLFDSQANRTLSYVNNHEGQVMKRFETQGTSNVIRNFYSLNGIVIGDAGTDKKASVVDYAQALADYDRRTLEAHVARNGDLTHFDDGTENGYDVSTTEMVTRDRNIAQRVFPVTSADFDQNYQPITDSYPAHTPQSYVTRSGDDLRSVALAVWGDASLWYLLADANGLTGSEQIPAGTRLTVPNVVTNIHNNSTTFRPYDPGFALGDTTPTLPDPPPPSRNDGCGTMGMIVVMVVVIIVCIFTEQWYLLAEAEAMAGAAAAAGDIMLTGEAVVASGAMAGTAAATEAAIVGAAAGNLAGQAVANMIGMQHGFSMESFMSSVLTAGIGGAIGQIGSGTWGQMATAAANNAIGQGVNIITGQQQRFDWRGVAAATVSAPVSNWAGKGFAEMTDGSRFAYDLASGAVSQGISVAAHRGRERFNFGKVFGDAFGRAIGTSLAAELPRGGGQDYASSTQELQRRNAEDAAREGSSLSDFGPRSEANPRNALLQHGDGPDPGGFLKGPYVPGQDGGDFYYVYPTPIHNAITEEVLGSRLLQYSGDVVETTNHIDRPGSPYQKSDASFIHVMTGDELPDPTEAKWNPHVENAPKELQTPAGMETRRVAERAFQIFRSEYDGDLSPEARENYRRLTLDEQKQISSRLTNSWVRAAFELSQANLDAATPESIRNAYRDFAAALHPTQETSPLHQGNLWRSNVSFGERLDHYTQENYNPGPDSGAYRNTEDMYRYFFVDQKLPSTLDFSRTPVDAPPHIENPPGVQTTPGGAVTRIPRRR